MDKGFIEKLTKEAQKALESVDSEITSVEAHLNELRGQREKLAGLVGGTSRPRSRARTVVRKVKGKRVVWSEALKNIPEKFAPKDFLKVPEVAARGEAQIYPALDRLVKAKLIKRVGKGEYVKVAQKKAA